MNNELMSANICPAKKSAQSDQEELTAQVNTITFLNIDGSLTEEKFVLSEQNVNIAASDDNKKFGKIEHLNDKSGTKKFFLKKFRGGRPGEVLPDPYGLLTNASDMSTFLTQRGHRFCEYFPVNENLFNGYQTYLRNRNPLWFKAVERTILNGE